MPIFDYAAVVVMLILIGSYYAMRRLEHVNNYSVQVMMYANLGAALMDIFIVYLTGATFSGAAMLLTVAHFLYYFFHTTIIFGFVLYYRKCLDRSGSLILGQRYYLFLLPMLLDYILLFANLTTGAVYYLDAQGIYHRGPLLWLNYVISFFYLASFLILVFSNKLRLTKTERVISVLYIAMSVSGVVLQMIFPNLWVESFAVSMALLLFVFTMSHFSETYNEKEHVFERSALVTVMENDYKRKDSFELIFLKLHNIRMYRITMGRELSEHLLSVIEDFLQENYKDFYIYEYLESEFVLLPKHAMTSNEIAACVKQIDENFSMVWTIGGNELQIPYHVGSILCGKKTAVETPEKLWQQLDYINDNVRNIEERILYSGDVNLDFVSRKFMLEELLRQAIANDGFEMYYQPIYSVREGRVTSAEALIRLKQTDHGYISPEEFIPIAEKKGMILQIGEFAFRSVCQFVRDYDLASLGIEYVEVNLSVAQCMQEKLYLQLESVMKEYGIDSKWITLEITETAKATELNTFRDNVFQLKKRGYNFALDDYGTGYSNLETLYRLPFKIIKIDKSMLWGAQKNEKAMIMLENSVKMAKSLGMEVVVEGVETKEQKELLESLGCEYLQGYYFSKPIPKKKFLSYVENETRSA